MSEPRTAVQGALAFAENEVEDAFADGRLSLLQYPVRRAGHGFAYVGRQIEDDEATTVHVMSKPAGGEIRGYMRMPDRSLRLRLPCYTGDWPEMDEAVRRRVDAAEVIR